MHFQIVLLMRVAEQNMAGLAAGMASEGYHAFVYSIANFPTFRCAEQFRNDIDYQGLPVTVVAVGGGPHMVRWVTPITLYKTWLSCG